MDDEVGVIAGGAFGEIVLRKDSDKDLELGQLLVYEKGDKKLILKVVDLVHGSTLPQSSVDMAQGYAREEGMPPLSVYESDEKVSYFTKAIMKPLVEIRREGTAQTVITPKSLPEWWEAVRIARTEDLDFLQEEGAFLGYLRNGSRVINIEVRIPPEKLIAHHVLIAASTGKGKSNLVKVMLSSLAQEGCCGAFVIDPHGEYWGFHEEGLKGLGERVVLLSPEPPPGGITLRIHVDSLLPEHFSGITNLSPAQEEALQMLWKQKHGKGWLSTFLGSDVLADMNNQGVRASTLEVLRRKLRLILSWEDDQGIFTISGGEKTVNQIVDFLEDRKTVIVDTSSLAEGAELLISNVVASEVLRRHERAKARGTLDRLPPVGIVLEEAARVLGEGVEPNVLERIAREGRKFKVGLIAVTQLPSLIQKELIANMNTKIILGNEARTERDALINSSPQDLSNEDEEIAQLDVGEGIVASSFLKMAVPIKVPLFEGIRKSENKDRPKLALSARPEKRALYKLE